MGIFRNREPRRYRPVNIYTDERKERLQKLIDEARLQQRESTADAHGNGASCSTDADRGNDPDKPAATVIEPDHFKGKFINYTPHLQRHKERSRRFGWPLWILLIFVMIILWRFLLR